LKGNISMTNDPVLNILEQVTRLSAADFKRFEGSLNAATAKAAELKREKIHADRMQAAANDPAMTPTVNWVNGRLKALGLNLHACADVASLNAALDKAGAPTQLRVELKTALARIGVLD
jgi:hypothetical protein